MKLTESLKEEILLFDGAMGTELQKSGIKYDCPERLNLEHTSVVAQVHQSYAKAGANIVETNTLGATGTKLKRHSLQDKVIEINRAAVKLAKDAVGDDVMVALSIGSTGELLMPFGTLDFDTLHISYSEQIEGGAQADILFFETMSDLSEARVGLIAAKETSIKPIVLSFTFEANMRTVMGNPPESCAILADKMGVSALGINCSGGPEELLPILLLMKKYSSLPIIVQPNAGLPKLVNGESQFPFGAQIMKEKMIPLVDGGASSIGGCCGTTPRHIELMKELIKDKKPPVIEKVDTDYLASRRAFVKLSDALNNNFEYTPKNDASPYDLMDIAFLCGDAQAVTLDVSDLSYDKIKELMLEGQDMPGKPLMFKVKTSEQAKAALRHYHGIAAIFAPDDSGIKKIAEKYGAYLID